MAFIRVIKGSTPRAEYEVVGEALSFGRKSDNDVVIDDHQVSRKHARLFRENGGWFIEDLGSVNGIQVEGRTVKGRVAIGDAVRFCVGGATFEFTAAGPPAAGEPAAESSGGVASHPPPRAAAPAAARPGAPKHDRGGGAASKGTAGQPPAVPGERTPVMAAAGGPPPTPREAGEPPALPASPSAGHAPAAGKSPSADPAAQPGAAAGRRAAATLTEKPIVVAAAAARMRGLFREDLSQRGGLFRAALLGAALLAGLGLAAGAYVVTAGGVAGGADGGALDTARVALTCAYCGRAFDVPARRVESAVGKPTATCPHCNLTNTVERAAFGWRAGIPADIVAVACAFCGERTVAFARASRDGTLIACGRCGLPSKVIGGGDEWRAEPSGVVRACPRCGEKRVWFANADAAKPGRAARCLACGKASRVTADGSVEPVR